MCTCVLPYPALYNPSWTVAHHAPLSMRFSRQKYWSRMPFTTPGHLPNSGIEPTALVSSAWPVRSFTTSLPVKCERHFLPSQMLSPFCLKSTDLISVTVDYYYFFIYCSRVVSQSWPTLCDLVECSPPGFSVRGLLQAGILGWVAVSFSRDLPDPGI